MIRLGRAPWLLIILIIALAVLQTLHGTHAWFFCRYKSASDGLSKPKKIAGNQRSVWHHYPHHSGKRADFSLFTPPPKKMKNKRTIHRRRLSQIPVRIFRIRAVFAAPPSCGASFVSVCVSTPLFRKKWKTEKRDFSIFNISNRMQKRKEEWVELFLSLFELPLVSFFTALLFQNPELYFFQGFAFSKNSVEDSSFQSSYWSEDSTSSLSSDSAAQSRLVYSKNNIYFSRFATQKRKR